MLDLILRDGLIYDGKGDKPYKADIGIKNGKIIEISQHIQKSANQIEDISGRWVCPGFVDIHTHYDAEIEINPSLNESVRHGVTSIVMGNCSMSLNVGDPTVNAQLFERVETMPDLISMWQTQAKKWPNTRSYFQNLNQIPIRPNVAVMAGHSAIRSEVMGLKRSLNEKATIAEIRSMAKLAKEALDAGCIGVSIDMIHWHRTSGEYAGRSLPSHYANYQEYAALASVCRERDAVFQLTPNPKNLLPSIINILRLSHGISRAPLRCTILSAIDLTIAPLKWRGATAFASICNTLFSANIRFQTLPEPFTIYADGPITSFFEEFEAGYLLNNLKTTSARQTLWQEPTFKSKFKQDWTNLKGRTFSGDLKTIYVVTAPDKTWHNKSIFDISNEQRKDPLDFFISALELYDTDLRWKHTGANRNDKVLCKLVNHPYILPGFSDAGAHCRNLAFFDSALTLIKQCAQKKWLPIEKAIKRITHEPAKWFNLETGSIAVGTKADLVILSPDTLKTPLIEPRLINDPDLNNMERMVKRYINSPVDSVFIAGIKVVASGEPINKKVTKKTGNIFYLSTPDMTPQQSYNRYRNRINNEVIDHKFKTYWDIFVLKHQNYRNIQLHLLAFIIMYIIIITAINLQDLRIMLLMPLSQFTGYIGHYRYERSAVDNRDLIFSWRAVFCLHKLFYLVITNKYSAEIKRVN